MIIAVDFDGTLCKNRYPKIGEANYPVICELMRRRATGDRLILWTCRCGKDLKDAVEWCRNRGLTFDAVNANLPEHIKQFGNDSRKVYADEYWDDKSVRI